MKKKLSKEFLVSLNCGDIFEYAYDYIVDGKDVFICQHGMGCLRAEDHIKNKIFDKIFKNRIKFILDE